MNVEFNKLDDVTAEIKVTIQESDYAPKVAEELKKISKNHVEKGFRPGHAPKGLVEKKYGPSVKLDAVNEAISDGLYNYIRDNKVDVLGNPLPKADEKFNVEDKEFTVNFEVALAPEINVDLDNLQVPYYQIQVSPQMVDQQIDGLRRQFGSQVPEQEYQDDALVKGVITELNADDSAPLEDGIVQQTGIIYPKYFKSEEQKALFTGKKVGDAVIFNPRATCDGNPNELASMLNISKEDAENVTNDFEINITEIIVAKPAELNQEFFDDVLGKDKAHNEEEFRAEIAKMLAQRLQADSNYRFSIDARDKIVEMVGPLKVNHELLKKFLISQNETLTPDNIEEEYKKAQPSLEWDIIRGNLLNKLDIKVTDDYLLNTAMNVARAQFAQYGMNNVPDESLRAFAEKLLADKRSANQIYSNTVDMKLYDAIRQKAKLEEKQVSVDEFNSLFRHGIDVASEQTED